MATTSSPVRRLCLITNERSQASPGSVSDWRMSSGPGTPPTGQDWAIIEINTGHCRWWTYQLWVKFFPEIDNPIFMPAHVANKIESLTYVEDVASAVQQVISVGESAWNQAYNIAMEEEFSLANILLRMRDGLGVDEEQF